MTATGAAPDKLRVRTGASAVGMSREGVVASCGHWRVSSRTTCSSEEAELILIHYSGTHGDGAG